MFLVQKYDNLIKNFGYQYNIKFNVPFPDIFMNYRVVTLKPKKKISNTFPIDILFKNVRVQYITFYCSTVELQLMLAC